MVLWLTLACLAIMAAVFCRRLEWGLAMLVFALPFERIGSFPLNPSGYPLVRPSQLIGLALILAWLASTISGRIKVRAITGCRYLLFFVVSAGIGAATVNYPTVWLDWAVLLFYCTLFFVVAQLTKESSLPLIAKSLFASALLVSLFGLYQYLGDIAGLSTQLTKLLPAYTKAVFGFPRIQSTALEPLFFANYLLLPLFVGLGLVQNTKQKKWWHYAGMSVIGLAFVLTTSRGAFIAAFIGAAAFLMGQRLRLPSPRAALEAVGIMVLVALIGGGLIGLSSWQNQGSFLASLKNFVSWNSNVTASPSYTERAQQIRIGRSLLNERQPFGIGLGGIGPRLDGYPVSASKHFVALNNEGLELLIQAGYIGYLVFAAFLISLLARTWLLAQKGGGWIVGLLAAVVATVAQAQTFSGFFLTHRWVALGLLAGLVSQGKPMALKLANLRRLV